MVGGGGGRSKDPVIAWRGVDHLLQGAGDARHRARGGPEALRRGRHHVQPGAFRTVLITRMLYTTQPPRCGLSTECAGAA